MPRCAPRACEYRVVQFLGYRANFLEPQCFIANKGRRAFKTIFAQEFADRVDDLSALPSVKRAPEVAFERFPLGVTQFNGGCVSCSDRIGEAGQSLFRHHINPRAFASSTTFDAPAPVTIVSSRCAHAPNAARFSIA